MSNIAIFIPTLKKGGAEKQAILLANALGGDNNILFILLYPELGIEQDFLKLVSAPRFELIKLEGSLARKIYILGGILRRRNVNSLFCYLTKTNLLGSMVGRISGVKFIYQGIRSTFLPMSKIFIEKIANLISDGIVVNCYSGKNVFSNKGLKNIIVIPNCYINPLQYIVRKQRPELSIISVGRFVPEKDYYTALKAIAKLKDKYSNFSYKIVGYGELENEIRQWTEDLGVSENVEIIINPKNVMDLLKDADIYLSTSSFEGTSNSIMEAMDVSLPIVATKVGDNNILVEEGGNGYLADVRDSDVLAESLLKLARNSELRSLHGRRSNELLREKYSFEEFKRKYLELIK